MEVSELLNFSINVKFKIVKPCVIHGIGGWFEAMFKGSTYEVILNTSPYKKPTHWYQVRFLFEEPIAMNKDQILKGVINFQANKYQSYKITIKVKVEGLNIKREGIYDLKNPDFRINSYNSSISNY